MKTLVSVCKCGHAPHGNESCNKEQCQCSATRRDDYLHARLRDAANNGSEQQQSQSSVISLMAHGSQKD
jgi:hypothetical protein